ncbi:MAG: hypothetical protein LUD47_00620 [Clostridia bacterium]|nr:hypothetical protein [Clostridia bacterium]
MLKVICSPKGTGKSKEILALANEDAAKLKGISIFITPGKDYMYELDRKVKFIDIKEYEIAGKEAFLGFVKGIAAANSDTEYLYLDGAARICGLDIEKMEDVLLELQKLGSTDGITITLTCSYSGDKVPGFVEKYM